MAGAVKADLIESFHISLTTFSSLGAMYFYAYLIMQIPSGILADYVGPKKVSSIGILLAGISSIGFAFSPNIYYAFLFRLLVGIGVSVIYICILKILTQWFRQRRFATMAGLTAAVGNVGGILAQSPLVIMALWLGWRNSFILVGVITIIVGVIAIIVVKDNPMGQVEVGKVENQKSEIVKAIVAVFRNKHTWPPFIMFATFFGAFFALTGTWGISYLSTVYGIEQVHAGNLTMVPIIGFAIGAALLGMVSDKLKKRKTPILILGSIYVCMWGILVFFNSGGIPIGWIPILFFILGLCASAFTLVWSCGKEVNDPEFAGISTSIVNMAGFVGAIILPVFMGMYLEGFDADNLVLGYRGAFFMCFVFVLVGLLVSFAIKETGCRNCYREDKHSS